MEEAYSAFQGTGLADRLKRQGIRRLFLGGLATDYCVKHTVLDALSAGFETICLEDASKGVEAAPGDTLKAVAQMRQAGAFFISFNDLKTE
jgi:nicotinamidase/pyrazinamidase